MFHTLVGVLMMVVILNWDSSSLPSLLRILLTTVSGTDLRFDGRCTGGDRLHNRSLRCFQFGRIRPQTLRWNKVAPSTGVLIIARAGIVIAIAPMPRLFLHDWSCPLWAAREPA
jgi:hypothetical protein